MPANRRRIELLHRVSRLRELEKRKAAVRLAEAQGLHSKLLALHGRSSEIVASYSSRRDWSTGGDLAGQLRFTAGVEVIRGETANESRKAEDTTRTAMTQLRSAERRHEITAQVLSDQQRAARIAVEKRDAAELARKLKGHV